MSPWDNQQAGVAELAPPDNLLATVADFCERYGLTFPPAEAERAQIETELEVASSIVRQAARDRIFTPMTDDEVTIDGSGRRSLQLPVSRLPVRGITSIVDVEQGTDPIDADLYSWSEAGIVEWIDDTRRWTARRRGVTVVYSHGYLVVPRAIEGVVMSLAKRLLDNPGGSQIQSEGVGGWSITYATGSIGLTELEAKVLERAGGGAR